MDNDESTKPWAQFKKFWKLISLKIKKSSKGVNKKNSFTRVIIWPTEAVFYRSARTEQNKSIKVLFPEPKPNRTYKNLIKT